MMKRMLLIVDPQIDFITGSLPVPGAEETMDNLAEYLHNSESSYSHIVVTADRHPLRHCSFKSEGGPWPVHCVADSVGAAIWPAIMQQLIQCPDKVTVLHKGENLNVEEYSILKNSDAAERIRNLITTFEITDVDICGVAGDVCVADTIRDWNAAVGPTKLHVLKHFSPSIDGGKILSDLIVTHCSL